MPDATEWLVEFVDQDGAHEFDHCDTLDDVQVRVRNLFDAGIREVSVYQRVPFTVQVDVTVQAPRKRKRKEAKEGAADLARGETAPARESASFAQATAERTAEPTASPVSLIPTGKEEESPKEGAERRPAPSPVSVWDCEVDRYGEDGPCAGPIIFDEVTHGRFCEMHMVAAPSGRAEWHRRNGRRNRPAARVA